MTVSRQVVQRVGTAVTVVVLVALLGVAIARLDLARVGAELARARLAWIVAALLCFLAILPLWAAQWQLLAPRGAGVGPGWGQGGARVGPGWGQGGARVKLGHDEAAVDSKRLTCADSVPTPSPLRPRSVPPPAFSTMLGVVSCTSSVLNTTPMLVGEAAGVYFLAARAGVDRASGVAVLAMDQLLVGVAKVCVLYGASLALPLPLVMREGLRALMTGVALLCLALGVVAWGGPRLRAALTRPLPARLAAIALRAADALAPLRSPVRGGGALLIALLKKGAELLAILAIQRAFGVRLDPASALVVLAALNLATLLPIVPGNAGVFEAAVVLAYAWLGVPPERALGMAVVHHACYLVALALPGYWWLAGDAAPRRAPAAS